MTSSRSIFNDFQHQPLPETDALRILKLEPASKDTDEIRFSLSQEPLDERFEELETVVRFNDDNITKYIAVSYTWDAQPFDCEAICAGQRFMITKNCKDILLQLRHPTSSVALWIDQISVNQKDDEDKSRNVRQMARIFNGARAVIIWTGPCDDKTLDYLARMVGPEGSAPILERMADINSLIFSLGQGSDNYEPRVGDHDIATAFEDRNWFKRMWTLQEVAMVSHRGIFIMAGTKLFSMERIGNTAMYSGSASFSRIGELWQTKNRFNVRFWLHTANSSPTAFSLFNDARRRACSEPKDKIFALSGMVGRAVVLDKLQPGFPEPDYGKDVAKVYQEAAIWALTRQKELEFLYLAAMSVSETSETVPTADLPSWVPDFGRLAAVHRRGVPTLTFHSLGPWEGFTASTPPIEDSPVSIKGSYLHLTGILCDYIKNVSAEIPHLADEFINEEDPNAAVPWILTTSQILIDYFAQVRSHIDGLADKTFHLLSLIPDTVDISAQQASLRQWSNYLASEQMARNAVTSTEDNIFNAPWLSVFKFDFPPDIDSADIPAAAHEAAQLLTLFLRKFSTVEKCCLFTTHKGSVGVLFGNIEDGYTHRLAFVRGLDRPLVLRPNPTGGGIVLVGHAFVEGCMDGRVWVEDALQPEEIIIC